MLRGHGLVSKKRNIEFTSSLHCPHTHTLKVKMGFFLLFLNVKITCVNYKFKVKVMKLQHYLRLQDISVNCQFTLVYVTLNFNLKVKTLGQISAI